MAMTATADVTRLAAAYRRTGIEAPDPDPLGQFACWLEEWRAACPGLPASAVLATADHHGRPSARWVDVAHVDHGFVFFTHHASRKAADLAVNRAASLCFGWLDLGRQIRVDGTADRLTDVESDAHFAGLPRSLQTLAWASEQSAEIGDREVVRERFGQARERFAGQEIPRPVHWGGYRVTPLEVEFWQRRGDEIQDRLRYHRDGAGWRHVRLAP